LVSIPFPCLTTKDVNMDKNENNFLDSKTILAIALVGIVWFAWQSYLNKKYQAAPVPTTTEQGPVGKSENITALPQTKGAVWKPLQESTEPIDSENSRFVISSHGLGLKNVELKKFTDREKNNFRFNTGSDKGLFYLSSLDDVPVYFSSITKSGNTITAIGNIGKVKITQITEYNPSNYSFKNTVSATGVDDSFKGLSVNIPQAVEKSSGGSFLLPSYEHQEFVVFHSGGKEERINISSLKENIDKTFNQVSVGGISSQYFTAAISDKSEIIPEVKLHADPQSMQAKVSFLYKLTSTKDQINLIFNTYAGPKARPVLENVDSNLINLVNFGFFSSIGKILLVVLKWFQSFVGNWGWSIILLTILVRLIVLPFNMASYKSMKKMQKIQPMMQSLRERYKDDPQTQQREIMSLMKEQKVNPLGGCLPMLLQMPVFFALFQVLGNSIELYQAPFIFWIHDLSLKDPYYVLPILMGASLWMQQKITPSTMDPAQAKVMQFMPIIFSLMMVTLPSGLTLYTFVSTLFGIIQQQFFMRDKSTAIATKEAKA
jgi:YidC/Oxa1 family membrane protein insertase